jgi:hypothetical protein
MYLAKVSAVNGLRRFMNCKLFISDGLMVKLFILKEMRRTFWTAKERGPGSRLGIFSISISIIGDRE